MAFTGSKVKVKVRAENEAGRTQGGVGYGKGRGSWGAGPGAWWGPLMGGPQCRLSILGNGNVPCRYFKHFPVDFRIVPCPLSILRKVNVPCHYLLCISLGKGCVALSNLRVKGHMVGVGGICRGPWRGVLMSHVDFKKWQCRLFLSLKIPLVSCQIEVKTMFHVTILLGPCLFC